jgi:hypothetical protein
LAGIKPAQILCGSNQRSRRVASRHVPRRARRRIQRPARRRGSPSPPSSKPDGKVNQPHRAIRLRPETARRGESTAKETRNTEGKSGQRIRGEIERWWVSGDDSCGQAVMQKARGERSSDFFLLVASFLGALRSGLSLGGCRNEFVGEEENVPETANRSGCVHGPVGCWTSKSWVGLLYLSPG